MTEADRRTRQIVFCSLGKLLVNSSWSAAQNTVVDRFENFDTEIMKKILVSVPILEQGFKRKA